MCYHISFEVKLENILDVFPELVVDPQLQAEFSTSAYINGFNHGFEKIMLTGRKDGKRHLAPMMWGMLPDTVPDYKTAIEKYWQDHIDENGKLVEGIDTLNAKGETLLERPLYRESALSRRCIMFLDAFYEWRHIPKIGKKGQELTNTTAYPYNVTTEKRDYPFIMMAGIWRPWKHTEVNKTTNEARTFFTPCLASCTAKANHIMAQVHNKKKRMPTMLTMELAREWLKPNLPEKRIVEIATYQYPWDKMSAYSLHKGFQTSSNPKEPYHYDELPPLLL